MIVAFCVSSLAIIIADLVMLLLILEGIDEDEIEDLQIDSQYSVQA